MSAPPSPTGSGEDPERVPTAERYVGVPRTAARGSYILIGIAIAIAAIFVGQLLVAAVDPSLRDADPDTVSDAGNLGVQLAVVVGLLAASIGVTARANGEGVGAALRRLGLRRFGPGALGWMLVAFGLYVVAAIAINSVFDPQQEDIAENLGADEDAAAWITVAAGILIIAGAAAGEELMFRGFVFGGLRQQMSLWPAALLSGALFGVLHLTAGDLAVALQLTAFGVILSWLYERTGVLWAPLLLHAFNNSIAFALLVTDTI